MSSHIQFFKDQLKQFDMNVQQWRQEIDERYAWIAKEQEARLRVQAMMEQIFGTPETTIVMQDMGIKAGMLAGRAPALAALAAPAEAVIRGPASALEERAERQRERKRLREHTPERRNYKQEYARRKREERRAILAKYGQHGEPEANGTSIDRRLDAVRKPRADKGITRGPGRHRAYSDQVRRIFLDRPATPMMTREVLDLVFAERVPTKSEKQCVYQCLYDLKRDHVIVQSRPMEPYTLVKDPAA